MTGHGILPKACGPLAEIVRYTMDRSHRSVYFYSRHTNVWVGSHGDGEGRGWMGTAGMTRYKDELQIEN